MYPLMTVKVYSVRKDKRGEVVERSIIGTPDRIDGAAGVAVDVNYEGTRNGSR